MQPVGIWWKWGATQDLLRVEEKAWSCMLMRPDRPSSSVPIKQTLVPHLPCVPGTRSRAKGTKMITSLEELVDLQGVHQCVLEVSINGTF